MSSIGSVDFDIMRGPPAVLGQRVDVWQVPGVDGYGAQVLGLGNGKATLKTISYMDNIDDAFGLVSTCKGLEGTMQGISDDWGNNYANVLIVRVSDADCYKPMIYKGNANAVRVELEWEVLST